MAAKASGNGAPAPACRISTVTGYRYRSAKEAGSLRYEFSVPSAGAYEVGSTSRRMKPRTNTPVTVESVDGRNDPGEPKVAAPEKAF